jgi:hypothetical protein
MAIQEFFLFVSGAPLTAPKFTQIHRIVDSSNIHRNHRNQVEAEYQMIKSSSKMHIEVSNHQVATHIGLAT